MNAYINASQLMEIVPIGKTKAYEIIKAINEELKAMGKITIRGKAPRGYTLEKLAIKKTCRLREPAGQGVNKKPIGRVNVVPYLF